MKYSIFLKQSTQCCLCGKSGHNSSACSWGLSQMTTKSPEVKFYVYDCGPGNPDDKRFMPIAEVNGEEIWFDRTATDKITAERNLQFGKALYYAGRRTAIEQAISAIVNS